MEMWEQSPHAGASLSLICFSFKPGSPNHTWHNSTRTRANHQYLDLIFIYIRGWGFFFVTFLLSGEKVKFSVKSLDKYALSHTLTGLKHTVLRLWLRNSQSTKPFPASWCHYSSVYNYKMMILFTLPFKVDFTVLTNHNSPITLSFVSWTFNKQILYRIDPFTCIRTKQYG